MTAIKPVNRVQSTVDNEFYDLQGRKVNTQLKKGFYIQNGRKVIIK